MVAVVLAGCAKRPATTQASAPAPTGAAGGAGSGPSTGAMPGGTMGGPSRGPAAAAATPSTSSARPAPKEFAAIADLKDVHFDFDKSDIRPGDAKTLDGNAAWLKSHDSYLVLIEGHCDERGTNGYNLALGERRAKSTMNYLVSQGVQASRITILSYGEERPTCTEKNEGCWSKNRRAHFLVKPR
ncbi:MAG: peptidoglycan-associated lipoprotein Pal [Candidatus Rokubacteria bacterium]|nr:peptidoglycan-associated lipoprotein Pal [Candidatus Rokubacteria bacterium]